MLEGMIRDDEERKRIGNVIQVLFVYNKALLLMN